MKKIIGVALSLMLVFALSGCAEEAKEIKIGEGDWDSNAFHDQIAKFIIENGYDTDVNVVTADTAVMVSGMKTNDIDATLELWSDNVPTYQDDIANGDYEELAVNFDDNQQGIYVPTYLVEGENALAPDLKTVEDLKDYAHLFPNPENPDEGIIYGGPEGWSATAMLHNKMEAYGLDEYYNFKTIDSNATLSATWIMGIYDMTLLEDSEYSPEDFEQGIGAFPAVKVTVCVNSEFEENHPEVYEFLSNYETSSAITSQGLGYMQENEVEAEDAAMWFLVEHEEMWKPMVSEEAYDKIIEALSE
jgi:glycine betaine/proline transport system substrate-binding protein